MAKTYPGGSFSVILNTANNPWANSGQQLDSFNAMLKRKSKANSLETAVRKAIQRVKSNFNQQQRLYREIERNLQGSSAKNFNLQSFLKDSISDPNKSVDSFKNKKTKNNNNNNIQKLKNDLKKANTAFRLEFQNIISSAAKIKNEEEIQTCFRRADNALNELYLAFEQAKNGIDKEMTDINKDIQERIDRISNKNASLIDNLSFSKDGNSFLIHGASKKTTQLFNNYQNLLKTHDKFNKGRSYRKGNISDKKDKLGSKWRSIEKALFASLKEDFGEQATDTLINKTIELMVDMFATGEVITPQTLNSRLNLAQESGFIFEGVANFNLQQRLEAVLKTNGGRLLSGGSVTEHVRTIFKLKPFINKNTKKQVYEALQQIRDKGESEYNAFISEFKTLDKIDDYITFNTKDTRTDSLKKYAFAFSDKLYKNLNNISLLTGTGKAEKNFNFGEESISGSSNLLNSYDLIANAGVSADSFIFSALNLSAASIYYSPYMRNQLTSQLKALLTSFVYEVAYNPDSFVENVLQETEMDQNVLYLHRIGPQVVPSFVILKNVIEYLEGFLQNIQKESMVQVGISYDNTTAASYISALNSSPELYKKNNTYNSAAWNYVSSQVASNTLMNIHLNLLAGVADLSADWSKFKLY